MSRSARLWLSWGLMAVVLVSALALAATADRDPTTQQERVYDVAATLACPVCDGQSVAESDVAVAREIRGQIGSLVEQGYTDDEIRDQIATGYEEDIRLEPSTSGLTGLVWFIPLVGAALAAVVLVFAYRRWSDPRVAEPSVSADDRALVADALDEWEGQHR